MDMLRRLIGLFSRAAVVGVTAPETAGSLRKVQVKGLGGLVRSEIEHAEPYGFTSRPGPGSEAWVANVGASSDHAVAVCISDRRYRVPMAADWDVAVHHHDGDALLFTSAFIALGAVGAKPINITSALTTVFGALASTGSVTAPVVSFTTLSGPGISGGGGTLSATTLEASGAFTGTFIDNTGKTVTVAKGIVMSVV